ncbi:MAG TPA: NAD(P)H-binding protein [Hyphomicrobiales bacterium]|nr:NAD(P)H-binding protein [Hyphomicrobiales bacterium]
MKIALIGATGRIGACIRDEALSRGHTVEAIARNVSALPQKPGLHAVACDVADAAALARAIKGVDAVVVSVDWAKTDVKPVYAAMRQAGVRRLLAVGGASSLSRTPGGPRSFDMPDFPENLKPIVGPAVAGLDHIRTITDLDWTYVSPSLTIDAGERTGKFRLDTDTLLVDTEGKSFISREDFAIAVVDELEHPQFIRKRFTVGY